MKQLVPICNICNKPHFGKNKVEDRCICDISGNYRLDEIEVDKLEEIND